MLRRSFAIRAAAMTAPLLVLPLPVLAPVFVMATSMLGAIGFAGGQLAGHERRFRLSSGAAGRELFSRVSGGAAVVGHYARYLARTSGAMTFGQLVGAGVIAVAGPVL